ncbi:MAG: cytochrome c maturation protein CcmE [Armatimonadetes bacterium]|nr:cytochrome c maturation protein CcmE [Armatimonadota bacterium]
MKAGVVVSAALALAGMVGLATVFVNNASPYVTVVEAQGNKTDVHVVGEIVPGSLQERTMDREVRFALKDKTGEMQVVYNGPPQSNLASAKQVVVIGSLKDGKFACNKMLVKCPSKYENDKTAKPDSSKA